MDLYSDIILDHYKHPHHRGELKKYSHRAVEYNPLCGDTIQVDLLVDRKGGLKDVGFVGSGCAISQAAMSLLSDWLKQKNTGDIRTFSFDDMVKMLHVPISPSRAKCATLGLAAVKKALKL
mgnify:FL=1